MIRGYGNFDKFRSVTADSKSGRLVDGHSVRPEIQALRAIAVLLVVVYHVESRLLPGGYIGVDVFFVISGFLITGHIARKIKSAGGLQLKQFYARRIRRLLPAALAVLTVVSVLALVSYPDTAWNAIGRQVVASVFYVQNWELAATSVDYLAALAPPTPVQHFWSLSLEEQFYLMWPISLLCAAWIGRRVGGVHRALVACMVLLVALSFAASVWLTGLNPSWAYFITLTRIWELGAGGLVALTVPRLQAPDAVCKVMSWLGSGLIVACGFLYSAATPFPGYMAAVPVIGTVLVIAAGGSAGRLSTSRIFDLRITQVIGDLSYSIYLWHWPILVMTPLIIGGPGYKLPIVLLPVPLVLCGVIALLSKRYIEDPFRVRSSRPTSGNDVKRARVLLMVTLAALSASTLGASSILWGVSQSRIERATAEFTQFSESPRECAGAASVTPICANYQPTTVQPDPIIALIASTDIVNGGCELQREADSTAFTTCEFGNAINPSLEVAVLGDSHANQWIAALAEIARSRNWHVTTYTKGRCAFAFDLGGRSCRTFNRNVLTKLRERQVKLVITSAASGIGYGQNATVEEAVPKFVSTWNELSQAGIQVMVIADNPQPRNAGIDDPAGYVAAGIRFQFPLAAGLGSEDALVPAAKQSGVRLVDMNSWICFQSVCQAVIGGVLVYRDSGHLTSAYTKTLAPELESAIARYL